MQKFKQFLKEGTSKADSKLGEDRCLVAINKEFKGRGTAENVNGVVAFKTTKLGDKATLNDALAWAKKNKKKFNIMDAEITTFQGIKVKIYFNYEK